MTKKLVRIATARELEIDSLASGLAMLRREGFALEELAHLLVHNYTPQGYKTFGYGKRWETFSTIHQNRRIGTERLIVGAALYLDQFESPYTVLTYAQGVRKVRRIFEEALDCRVERLERK